MLMLIPGAATAAAMGSGSISAGRDPGAHEEPCVLGEAGNALTESAVASPDSTVGAVSADLRRLDQGGGSTDVQSSGASCKTFSFGDGDAASGNTGRSTTTVVSHTSIESSIRSATAESCTTFSSEGVAVSSALVCDEAPALVSSFAVQTLAHHGPATGNTTIRVGWKRR